jgi:hypothetical protein
VASSDGIVCIKDLAAQLGDPPGTSSVNAELKVLGRAGLLRREEGSVRGGGRRVYLLRQESAYWGFCLEVMAAGSGAGLPG